jgi:hypothetical protein
LPNLSRSIFARADTSAHIALSRKVYDTPATTDADHWIWKHAESPFGPSEVTALVSEGEMVGRTMRAHRPFRMAGSVLRGSTIMDFVIDPAFRRADQTIRLIKAGSGMDDCDVILHGSNEMSDPLYRKLFRYPIVGALTAAAFPLRIRGLVTKALGRSLAGVDVLVAPWRWLCRGLGFVGGALTGVRLDETPVTTEEMADMLEAFRKEAGPHFERSPKFLEWRFRYGPLFNARVLTIRVRGVFRGYIAVRRVEVDGFTFEVIVDFAHDHQISSMDLLAVRVILAGMTARTDADALFVIANFANDTIRETLALPMVPIPDRFLKHPTPMFAHVREQRENRLKALGGTFMTLADIDYL